MRSFLQTLAGFFTIITGSLLTGIYMILFLPVMILFPMSPLITGIIRVWASQLLGLSFCKVRLEGLENLDLNKNYIFVANHQSIMDIPLVYSRLPFQLRFAAKKELFRIPLFGWVLHLLKFVRIDRQNRKLAMLSLKKAAERIAKEKLSMILFPEGTRSTDGSIAPFKKGPFVLGIDSETDIVPLYIGGTINIHHKSSKFKMNFFQEVVLKIGQPISVASYSYEQRAELVALARETVIALQNEKIA